MAPKFLDRMEAHRMKRTDLQKNPAESLETNRETLNASQVPAVPEDPEQKRLASLFQAVNDKPCELTLSRIPKNNQTFEIVEKAIQADGKALRSASKKLITPELCKLAIQQNGLALRYVQKTYPQFLTDEMIEIAVKNTALAIAHVPPVKITKRLAQIAVCQPVEEKHFRNTGINKYPIGYIPDQFIDEQLVSESVMYSPRSIRSVPRKFLTRALWKQAISIDGAVLGLLPEETRIKDIELVEISFASDPANIRYVPEQLRTKKMCDTAFQKDPLLIEYIPEQYITIDMCIAAIKAPDPDSVFRRFNIKWIPESFWKEKEIIEALKEKSGEEYLLKWNGGLFMNHDNPLPKLTIVEDPTPPAPSNAELISYEQNQIISHDLLLNGTESASKIYYVTDLHIEHQFKELFAKGNGTYQELSEAIELKIKDMLSDMTFDDELGCLLVGGDVSCFKEIVSLFYDKLRTAWYGPIIAVLGNHELWDDHPDLLKNHDEGYVSRPIYDIVSDYHKRIYRQNEIRSSFLLQNSVAINYKNTKRFFIIEEDALLSVPEKEIRDRCLIASLIILGGIGFSGLNSKFNASNGSYRSAVTTLEQDRDLSSQFELVYDKLNRCAGDLQVIVLTHTPVSDWLSKEINPNWVYINGHTHRNSIERKHNGATILSDNQVGYEPIKWKLNSFTIAGWYDPFREMEDGITPISLDAYKEFNSGRSINCKGYEVKESKGDQIFVLKKKEIYMFILQSQSCLYLLQGGKKSIKLNRDKHDYFEKMDQLVQVVKSGISGYYKVLDSIAKEVKRFGGDGRRHGCRVDINFCSHIILNPKDGTITPYYAPDSKSPDHDSIYLYPDHLFHLLKDHAPNLCRSFIESRACGRLPLLGDRAGNNRESLINPPAFAPLQIKGEEAKEINELSRRMSAIQYLDNNVIRFWNDEILKSDQSEDAPTPQIMSSVSAGDEQRE